jgi:hypothetical protein
MGVADPYIDARQAMADSFEGNFRCDRYRRMQVAPADQSVTSSEKVVRRLMK